MSFVSQAFDEVRASLMEASGGSSLPPTRAADGCGTVGGAGDPHSRGATSNANWSGRRVASFFRDDKNDSEHLDQGGVLGSAHATRRRLRRGDGSVSRTADTALAVLLEGALRRSSQGAEAQDRMPNATDDTTSGPTNRHRSVEYNIELLVARAAALASEGQQRSGNCVGSAASAPYSPDSVAAGALDVSRPSYDNATGSDKQDFFGLRAASSTLQPFSTPTRPTTALVAADPPKGCWGDVEVDTDTDASISTSRNAKKDTEERVRSLCSQFLLTKGDNRSRDDDDELGGDDQLKMRKDVIRLLVLLSESPVTLSSVDNDGVSKPEMEDGSRQRPRNALTAPAPSFYNIRGVVPMGSVCRPAFEERDIVLWSTMALTGVPSPPYRPVGEKKLVQQPFNIHGESDSTSLFGVAQNFSDAGSNYLYLAGIADGHSSCEAWGAVIYRLEHHWLDRYRGVADAIKHEVECTSRDATPTSVSLLDVSVRARILMTELALLASIIRRLSRSKPNGSCDIQESLYQLIVMEQLSANPGNDESCCTLVLLRDLFQACLKGTVTKLYREICFGSRSQAGDGLQLPSFLEDLSDQIGEATKCIDLIRETDRSVLTRLASFHRKVGEGDKSVPFLRFGFTKEDLDDIIKAQDDRIRRYQALIQSELDFKGESSTDNLAGPTDRNDRELMSPSIDSSNNSNQHVNSGTFPDLPVSPSWKQSDSTGVSQFVWTNELPKEEVMNNSISSRFVHGGDLADTSSKFFALPLELSPTPGDSLSLLGDISAKIDNGLPIDISMERGIKRFIRRHCEMTEHFSLLFFVRRSLLLEHLVLVRRIFVGYGCYLTRLVSHCFLARVDDSSKVISGEFLRHLNSFCFIASTKEMELFESIDVNLSLLASDITSASNGLAIEHSSELPALQVQCPISSVINDAAIAKYRDIRAFIVRHLWVEEQRKLTWRRLVQMDRSRAWGNDSEAPRHLYIIRNEIGHLCSAFSQYINLSLQGSWQNLLNSLSLNSANGLGSMKEVCRLHQANLDDLRANFFLVEDDSSLARVKGQMDSLYKIILLILEALAPRKLVGDRLEDCPYLSSLWEKYGNGRKSLMRSLRIASSSNSFCRDFMELLAEDNAGSYM